MLEGQCGRRVPCSGGHSDWLDVILLGLHLVGLLVRLHEACLRFAGWLHSALLKSLVLQLVDSLLVGFRVPLGCRVVLEVLEQWLLSLIVGRQRSCDF